MPTKFPNNMNNTTIKYSYISGIDGLRAIAVLAVMIFHLNGTFLPGGFAGVDVFFVISGYVVARSLQNHASESAKNFIIGFYSRRIRRIVPALLFCLLVTTVAYVLIVPESWLSGTTKMTGIFAFFGLSNFALVRYQDDYFSPRTEYNPYTHTWSLGVEEQFYFAFPVLIFLWFRYIRADDKSITRHVFLWAVPLLSGISLYVSYYMGSISHNAAYYLIFSRFWELAAGVILYQLQFSKKVNELSIVNANLLNAVGLILIFLGLFFSEKENFPYPWAVLSVLGTFFSIFALTACKDGEPFLYGLDAAIFRYIGRISYSLYLWHWPVYVIFRWTVGLESGAHMFVAVIITFALAIISYYVIETPLRNMRFSKEWKAVAAGVVAIVISWQTAEYIYNARNQLSLSVTSDTYTWYPHAYADTEERKKTLHGRQIFVIGNSHAEAYRTMLTLLEHRHGIKVHIISTGKCAVGNMLYPINKTPGCQQEAEKYINDIKRQSKPGDTVLFASLRMHRISDQWYRKDPVEMLNYSIQENSIENVKQAYAETKPIISDFEELGLEVIFDLPKPVLPAPAYRCSDWFNKNNPICKGGLALERDFLEKMRSPVVESLFKLRAEFANIHLWDPLPILCENELCSAYDNSGKSLFFDGDHLSGHGNRKLYPEFEKAIIEIYSDLKLFNDLVLGQSVSFDEKSGRHDLLFSGWSHPETHHRWSDGGEAEINFRVKNYKKHDLILHLNAHAYLGGGLAYQNVAITANGVPLALWKVSGDAIYEAVIPAGTMQEDGVVKLKLSIDDPRAPCSVGESTDCRKLGIAVKNLLIDYAR